MSMELCTTGCSTAKTTQHTWLDIGDADWAGNCGDRKSTYGVTSMSVITWCFGILKRKNTSLSTTEVEYIGC